MEKELKYRIKIIERLEHIKSMIEGDNFTWQNIHDLQNKMRDEIMQLKFEAWEAKQQ